MYNPFDLAISKIISNSSGIPNGSAGWFLQEHLRHASMALMVRTSVGLWAVPNFCWIQHGDVPSRWQKSGSDSASGRLFLETYCLGSCRCWYVYWVYHVYPHSIIFNWYSAYWLVKYIHLSWAHWYTSILFQSKGENFILKPHPLLN